MRNKFLTGFALLAAGALAAGCGSSPSSNGVAKKSPSDIVSTAISAMKGANSVHVSGTESASGKAVAIDATIFSNGDIDGTIGEGGVTLGVVKIGSTDYVKASEAFYLSEKAPVTLAAEMAGKWISSPDSAAGFGNEFSLVSLASSLSKNKGSASAGTTSTLDGQPVVSVKGSDGSTMYVATTGTPYPLEITKEGGSGDSGTITLSQWNKASTPSAPAGARSVQSYESGKPAA